MEAGICGNENEPIVVVRSCEIDSHASKPRLPPPDPDSVMRRREIKST